MTGEMQNTVLKLYAELLPLLDSPEKRMEKLEEFDEVFGVDIPEWEKQLKELISSKNNAEACVKAIDDFYAKYHVYDDNGNKVYERTRIGNGLHQIVMTFDANAPEGQQLTLREVPDTENMDLAALRKYYEEVEARYSELEDEEPEDDESEEYEKWENECEEVEELMDDLRDKIEALGGET
jgi:hypothetical protein